MKAVLAEAWAINDAAVAQRRLERLASSLEANHPGAAGSVREGLDETLTLQRLGVVGALYRKLRSTNAIENLNSGIASYTRNVKRWRGGSMVVRWVSAAIQEARPNGPSCRWEVLRRDDPRPFGYEFRRWLQDVVSAAPRP